jgi:hypothetical protein
VRNCVLMRDEKSSLSTTLLLVYFRGHHEDIDMITALDVIAN